MISVHIGINSASIISIGSAVNFPVQFQ